MFKRLKEIFRNFIKKNFDYRIVGEYLDHEYGNHYRVKYIKKWYLRKNR